ncbi:MAG: glycosyltransferase family 2 protein [Candidatus Omnitrophota bacterium]|nr:glycosyltransferase family 2 protein [Candidatus Omnitrophota bacterium]
MILSIIIPVYNEEATIATIIERVLAVPFPAGFTKELVIVNDGSNDGTQEKLKAFSLNPQCRIFSLDKNQGKTAAVKLGLAQAAGDYIVMQDADLEYDPSYYPSLLEPILQGKADVVYGSRFQGTIQHMTFINRAANTISNLTINLLFHTRITDFHTCLKMFKRQALQGIDITSHHFSFDTEITVKLLKKGYTIHEVPIQYKARSREEGKKINWRTAIESYFVLLKLALFK